MFICAAQAKVMLGVVIMGACFLFWIHRCTLFHGHLPCECSWVIKLRFWSFPKMEGFDAHLNDGGCVMLPVYVKCCTSLVAIRGELLLKGQ